MKKNILLFILLASSQVYSAGFEKAVQWSARYSALGGAASAIVDGADAVYFNPAGMVYRAKGSSDLSVNISPTQGTFKGPIYNSTQLESENDWTPPAGFLISTNINEKWSFGAGAYVAGGTKAEFSSIDYSPISTQFSSLRPDNKSVLILYELALAAAYKVNSNFSLGFAWRPVLARGDFASSKVTYTTGGTALALSDVKVDDLKDENFAAFKLGGQYRADNDQWGLGLVWRTEVKIEPEGDASGNIIYTSTGSGAVNAAAGAAISSPATRYSLNGGERTVKNKFPHQVSLGSFYRATDKLTLLGEWTWTNYGANKTLEISGNLTSALTGQQTAIPDLTQNWSDQHNFRVGAEYAVHSDFQLRSGYALTTQVTDDQAALAASSSPGIGHTVVVGSGFGFLDSSLWLDSALEYSFASGDGKTPDQSTSATQVTPAVSGEFETTAFGAHISLRYLF